MNTVRLSESMILLSVYAVIVQMRLKIRRRWRDSLNYENLLVGAVLKNTGMRIFLAENSDNFCQEIAVDLAVDLLS